MHRGTRVLQRPGIHRGRSVPRFYQPRTWRHRTYYRYYPQYTRFAPNVCGYYHSPYHRYWRPFHYRWRWIYDPWWDWYGYYYRPYVYYTSPGLWLTDYMFITMMYAPYSSPYAYDSYGDGYRDGYGEGYRDGRVSEAEKEQIRSQIEEEIRSNGDDGQAPPSVADKLNDPNYLFVVSEAITTIPQSGSSDACTLSEGDLLKAVRPVQDYNGSVLMKVITSKKDSCPAGSKVLVSMEDLQRFQNDFSATLETGLERLETEKDGLTAEE